MDMDGDAYHYFLSQDELLRNATKDHRRKASGNKMVIHHPNNKAEFDALLVSAAGRQLIVIDFFAAWCGPCRMITPKFEAFSEEFPSVLFIKIDIDEQEEIAEDFKIDVMPTFVFLKDGNRLKRVVGNVPEEVHEAIIELSQ